MSRTEDLWHIDGLLAPEEKKYLVHLREDHLQLTVGNAYLQASVLSSVRLGDEREDVTHSGRMLTGHP